MAHRRTNQQAVDPDVEQSAAELARLQGEQSTVQTATEAIAGNKKKLEEDFAEASKRLAEELAAKRDEASRLIKVYRQQIEQMATDRDNATIEAQKARDSADTERKALADVRAQASILAQDASRLREDIKGLITDKEALSKENKSLTLNVKALEDERKDLGGKITDLKWTLNGTNSTLAVRNGDLERAKNEHEALDSSKTDKVDAVNALSRQINDKKTAITKAQEDLIALQKQAADQTAAMQKEKEERDQQVGNAARLEQRVDQKLNQLREAEKEFTTEHLARIGYKKIT